MILWESDISYLSVHHLPVMHMIAHRAMDAVVSLEGDIEFDVEYLGTVRAVKLVFYVGHYFLSRSRFIII